MLCFLPSDLPAAEMVVVVEHTAEETASPAAPWLL